MFRWQTMLGAVIGIFVGLTILALPRSAHRKSAPSGPILAECDGRMRELVVHYEPSAKEIVAAVYRDFIPALDPDVTVHVVCPDRPAFDEFVSLLGKVRCRLSPVVTRHPITTWSRDRWVALTPPGGAAGPTTLWSPRGESAAEIWPARAGDERVGQDIAAALAPSVRAVRSGLCFDGGDFLADDENVFVVPRVLQYNIQHTVASREEFLRALAGEFKRRIILLDESPDHHAGMFMASVGGHTMLVGDPHLGQKLWPVECGTESQATDEFMNLPGGPDFTLATQHRFDAVAEQCSAAGYRVLRIPVVPARDGRTCLTYVNVLLDRESDRRIVYLPAYQGVEALNAAAREVWEKLGFEVRPVDCTATYRYFGCLHCLVNVLKRS